MATSPNASRFSSQRLPSPAPQGLVAASAIREASARPAPLRVLLVCTANHCRSPLAEALLKRAIDRRGLTAKVTVESAALRQVKVGHRPSPTTIETAARRGLELVGHGTWASPDRVAAADLVVCMDHEQAAELMHDSSLEGERARSGSTPQRFRLLLEYAPECGREEVPDPHGLDQSAHERVADLIEQGVEGLADALAIKLESSN